MTATIEAPVEDLEKMLEDQVPCDFGDVCLSKMEKPGEWIITHKGGKPECPQIFCEDCFAHWKRIMGFGPRNGWGCTGCGANNMSRDDVVVRHL